MRNIATCYTDHAVRISDSYCSSGPLNLNSSYYVSPKLTPSIQNLVTCTYKSKLSNGDRIFITITWCNNNLFFHGFFIKFSDKLSSSKSELGIHHKLTKIKGKKSINSCPNFKIEVYWDLSNARFEVGLQPIGDFYIVFLVNSQTALTLTLDDDKDDDPTVEKLVDGLFVSKLILISQCEHVHGSSNLISTMARFGETGIKHEITIKCCPEDEGPKNPVLSVYIDRKRVVKVKKIQWNFRGNQVIFVDGLIIDVMWDVYGWYFDRKIGGNDGKSGLFMFRTRSGLDSRLWLEEEEKKLADKNHDQPEFSLLICAASKNPG